MVDGGGDGRLDVAGVGQMGVFAVLAQTGDGGAFGGGGAAAEGPEVSRVVGAVEGFHVDAFGKEGQGDGGFQAAGVVSGDPLAGREDRGRGAADQEKVGIGLGQGRQGGEEELQPIVTLFGECVWGTVCPLQDAWNGRPKGLLTACQELFCMNFVTRLYAGDCDAKNFRAPG